MVDRYGWKGSVKEAREMRQASRILGRFTFPLPSCALGAWASADQLGAAWTRLVGALARFAQSMLPSSALTRPTDE